MFSAKDGQQQARIVETSVGRVNKYVAKVSGSWRDLAAE
jgi:hypothetical protein